MPVDPGARGQQQGQVWDTPAGARAVLEAAPAAVVVLSEPHVVEVWNPAAERLFGYPAQEVVGRPFPAIPPLGAAALDDLFRIGEDCPEGAEFRFHRRDGSAVDLHVTAALVPNPAGGPRAAVLVFTDPLARKHAEEERRLEARQQESLGVLAGGLAHDFNNLLTTILGYTTLAAMDLPRGAAQLSFLNQVELAAQRAAHLCRQLLAYAGRGRFVVGAVDLSAVVRASAAQFDLSLAPNGKVTFRLADDLPPVLADAEQLTQIVVALVSNACEALGDAEAEVVVSTARVWLGRHELCGMVPGANPAEGEYVRLEVVDNGCGMDAATRARIFEPFFSTKFTGRGLSLPAVLGIARSHGGAVQVESEPGRGSIFRVLLPAAGERTV
jgi:PAS domain S-box-containing protein